MKYPLKPAELALRKLRAELRLRKLGASHRPIVHSKRRAKGDHPAIRRATSWSMEPVAPVAVKASNYPWMKC